ncbi:uncharacterized protein BBOV_IV001945 [Babesia bovis T2Bo]|uniref:uncharacterized protein n=1 Tax=Babesia bovis T2Bo TaxID=484906 RepID=UPI001DBF8FA9|nr:uncharacterized protein BBOV_IV001945 [Babesia bovis T2Bo]KAG6439902.1 hypothetical protein BBOV_IV001945 [Babesia bovis T2Bo]
MNIALAWLCLASVLVTGLKQSNLGTRGTGTPGINDISEYLLVQNARRFCDGSSIMDAASETPFEDAMDTCSEHEECTFFCHTAKKTFSTRPSDVLDAGNSIPQSDATWLCNGAGWTALYPKNGWVTAIKGVHLQNMCKPYTVWLNQVAECHDGKVLDTARDMTPMEAAHYCTGTKGCSFFTMSLESHDSTMAFGTVAKFCSGVPKKRVARDGHFFATILRKEELTDLGSLKYTGETRFGLYYGGPLTNDGYYDDKTPGSLVPAMKL